MTSKIISTLNPYTSAITAWLQNVCENPSAMPAPAQTQTWHPRPRRKAARNPAARAPVNAVAIFTLKAILPQGSKAEKSLPTRQNSGYPVGCGVPRK